MIYLKHYLEVHEGNRYIYVCHCCDKIFRNSKCLTAHLVKKHNYQLPSGHTRFNYRIDENGFHRLETTRIESLEVTNQILSPRDFPSEQDCTDVLDTKESTNTANITITLAVKIPN